MPEMFHLTVPLTELGMTNPQVRNKDYTTMGKQFQRPPSKPSWCLL